MEIIIKGLLDKIVTKMANVNRQYILQGFQTCLTHSKNSLSFPKAMVPHHVESFEQFCSLYECLAYLAAYFISEIIAFV